MTEHFATLHTDVPDGAGGRRPAVDIEHVCVFSLRVKTRREDAAIGHALFRRQDDRTRAVAEKYATGTIRVIRDPALRLGANDQGMFVRARFEKVAGGGHRIDESAARR